MDALGTRLMPVVAALGLLAGACAGGSDSPAGDGGAVTDLELAGDENSLDLVIAPDADAQIATEALAENRLGEATDSLDEPDSFQGFGMPCTSEKDCPPGGYCIEGMSGLVCTASCVESCPEDWECQGLHLYGRDLQFVCVPIFWQVCRECVTDEDCKSSLGTCWDFGPDGRKCTVSCPAPEDCPAGFVCKPFEDGEAPAAVCLPASGSCLCKAGDEGAARACEASNEHGTCVGEQVCQGESGWSDCSAAIPAAESCDGIDNDCNGAKDEGFEDTDSDLKADCVDEDDDADGDPDETDCLPLDPLVSHSGQEICDGLDNNCDGATDEGSPDTDNDSEPDCTDVDDDEDGIEDEADNCPLVVNPGQVDTDLDEAGNDCDDDDDGDEILDEADNCKLSPNPLQEDVDLDGKGDACDEDADADGTMNAKDCAPLDAAVHPGAEELCDGVDNDCSGTADEGHPDTDVDGIKDCLDTDDDNDGVPDDKDNCPLLKNLSQANSDDDEEGDACDPDDDNDTVPDILDNCPVWPNEDQKNSDGDPLGDACDLDDDEDQWLDEADNCPTVANADQADLDKDGQGDACDEDDDGDAVPDSADNCPLLANKEQTDSEQDGLGDVCDADDDNDFILDAKDNCPLQANIDQKNTDGDPLGDECDDDDDGDTIPDPEDNCQLVANLGQENCDDDPHGNACDEDDDNDKVADLADCHPCNPEVFPSAAEVCNGLDDNCNGLTDEAGAQECYPYQCGGVQGCLTACSLAEPCGAGTFCDLNDYDKNGNAAECLPLLAAGQACGSSFECADGACSNGHCCGSPTEPCCGADPHCAALSSAPVCDVGLTCTGHRVDGFCNAAHVCKTKEVSDPVACAGALCSEGKYCTGNVVRQNLYCTAAGSCAADGPAIQTCAGNNTCCTYGCSGGACYGNFNGGDAGCVVACWFQPVLCFCW
jgi:hypothetical protein